MTTDSARTESSFGPLARAQYAAVLQMRWRMLVNSLRTGHGKFELGSRVFATVFFAIIWLFVGTGCGAIAYQVAANRQFDFLAAVLWPVFLLWQVVPVLLSASQESVDFNFLLRFPVSLRSYSVLYLFFGLFDPSSMLGVVCLLGIWIGVVSAAPGLILWITLVLAFFGLFNFLLTRTIFAWIERWLAQRRTREVLGIATFVFFLAFQLLNPALRSYSGGHSINRAAFLHNLKLLQAAQSVFPPGLASGSVASAEKGGYLHALLLMAAIVLYIALAGALLALRLRAEFRGENFGEAPAPVKARVARTPLDLSRGSERTTPANAGWLDGPVGAVFQKELHILLRSGVMLFGLFAPVVLVFVMFGPMRSSGGLNFPYSFPIAIAYGFLPLARQFCNSLGTEGAGIQVYFLSPTPFRSVILGKNLLQSALFCVELALVATVAFFRFGMPGPNLLLATFCWVLFALPANLAAGNILSITLAYRMTLVRLSREQGSVGNGLLSLLIKLSIFAAGAAVYVPFAIAHREEFAAPILLLLAMGSWLLWRRILANVDGMAASRRETLMAALARAA